MENPKSVADCTSLPSVSPSARCIAGRCLQAAPPHTGFRLNQATASIAMIFGRKKPFLATDVFPLSDVGTEFEDSTFVTVSPARRALDGVGPRASRTLGAQWRAAAGLTGLYGAALGGFYLLDVVSSTALLVLVAIAVVTGVIGWLVTKAGVLSDTRARHANLALVITAQSGMLVLLYLAPVTQILFATFAFVAVAYSVFTVPRRTLLYMTAFMLTAYAIIIGLHYSTLRDAALLRLEMLHFLALLLSLPVFILMMGKVQRLYHSLYRASRKISHIQHDAQRDTLVGCYNRRYILAALEEQKQLADESGIPLCLAVLDIDHFKRINDELGHLGGDEALRAFARIAQEGTRGGDIFGRYGGEEFLLIFPGTSLLPSLNTCERIRAQVETHGGAGLLKCKMTVSIGVTQYVQGESVLEFFSRADTAMYMAKEGGRNQVVVQEPVAKDDSLYPAPPSVRAHDDGV